MNRLSSPLFALSALALLGIIILSALGVAVPGILDTTLLVSAAGGAGATVPTQAAAAVAAAASSGRSDVPATPAA